MTEKKEISGCLDCIFGLLGFLILVVFMSAVVALPFYFNARLENLEKKAGIETPKLYHPSKWEIK